MQLLFHPGNRNENGKLLPAPPELRKFISPWATAYYYEYPFGYSLIQQFFSKRFSIHIWRIHMDKPGKLYPASDRPIIALQFMLEGSIPCVLKGFGSKLLQRSRYELFYVPKSVNEAQFEPGNYESLHIEIDPGFLDEVITLRSELAELISRFQLSSALGMPMASAQMNYITLSILENLKTCTKKDESLQLEMHKYILELLSEYLSAILKKDNETIIKHISHNETILKVRDYILLAPNVHDHTLKNLVRQFKAGETSLKRGFKALNGFPISDYVRLQALGKAHYMVKTTKRTIEDISQEVGYSSREALERSFKKQYGYTPHYLRFGPK